MRIVLLGLALAAPLLAQEARPVHNTSFVPTGDEKARALVEEAQAAAARKEYDAAAELLQRLIRSGSPTVLPLRGRELFTDARRWAQIQLLAERDEFPRAVLDAWRKAHDERANLALRGAIAAGDERAIAELLEQFPAATAAPVALLALADRAWQHGDRDRARGYLLRVPEHLARSEEAAFLSSDAYAARRRFAAASPSPAPAGWPTPGGDATRARNGDPVPPLDQLAMRWIAPLFQQSSSRLEDIRQPENASPTLPYSAVADERYLYVHLGPSVLAIARESGKKAFLAPSGAEVALDVASEIGRANPGARGVTVHEGVLYFSTLRADPDRLETFSPHNELVAFDVATRQTLWRCGPWTARPDDAPVLRNPIFFRGAPAVAGARLFVYGAVRETSDGEPTRKEEAYLFCFERRTGRLLWHRLLGFAETDAPPRVPPVSGLPPAVSQGVVVVVTGVGVAAALDAESGEILWLLRYDRKPLPERARLNVVREKYVTPRPGWKREPPRIDGDFVHFAPVDSDAMQRCWLRGRRRPEDGGTALVCWSQRRDRDLGRNVLLEYVAGFHGGRGYYVGVRDPDRERWGYENVVSNDLEKELPFRYARLPATRRDDERPVAVPPELFGRPVLAGDVLLVPTRYELFAFGLRAGEGGEDSREIPPRGHLPGPELEHEEHEEPPPAFGNLLAIDGWLFAVTHDRVIAYGPKR